MGRKSNLYPESQILFGVTDSEKKLLQEYCKVKKIKISKFIRIAFKTYILQETNKISSFKDASISAIENDYKERHKI